MAGNGRRTASLRGIAALAAAALAGCAPGVPYQAPAFPFLSGYKATQSGAPVLLGNTEWWQRLDDPVLDRLVGLALKDSPSLAIARDRVAEAQAELRRVPGAAVLSSSVGMQGSGRDGRRPDSARAAQVGFEWLLDPYGEKREQLKAAGAQVEIADAEVDAAQLLLLYTLGNAYLELRYRQRILHLSRQELAGRRATLALTRKMLAADSATRLETTRSEARVAEIEARLPGQQAAISAKKNEIAVLAGTTPGTLPVDLDAGARQPLPKLSPDVGIPADLLRNRPDIRIAERRYYASVAEIGVAQAGLYPRLSLTGTITLNALKGGGSGTEYFFGPLLQFPTLPPDSARATVEARHARARQAHGTWKSTVLTAILEVENALLDYQAASASTQSANRAVRLYRETLGLTREVFEREDATLGDLIDAEQALAGAEQTLAETLYRRGQSFVALNVRLGSGSAAARKTVRTAN